MVCWVTLLVGAVQRGAWFGEKMLSEFVEGFIYIYIYIYSALWGVENVP